MFHVKHPQSRLLSTDLSTSSSGWPLAPSTIRPSRRLAARPRVLVALLGGLLFALLATGCTPKRLPANGWAAPVSVGNDTLLVQDQNGYLTALRIGSGQGADGTASLLWRFPDANRKKEPKLETLYANPVARDGVVYLATHNGMVLALDLATGRPPASWPQPVELKENVVATPALEGDRLLVPTERGALRAIDVRSGALVAGPLAKLNDALWSAPAIGNGTIYIASLSGAVEAIDVASGQPRWQRTLPAAVPGDPALDGDTLYAGTLGSDLRALDAATGEDRWDFVGDSWFWARPLVTADVVYAATANGSVYAIDRTTGRERWHFTDTNSRQSQFRATPVLVGGVLIVATRDGDITGLDPASGTVRWHQQASGQHLLADPLVLSASPSSVLYLTSKGHLLRVSPEDGAIRVAYQRN